MFYFTSTIIYITAYNALKMCDIHYLRITKLLYKRCVDDFALGAEQFVVVCMLKKKSTFNYLRIKMLYLYVHWSIPRTVHIVLTKSTIFITGLSLKNNNLTIYRSNKPVYH